ncbi:MAG: ATP-dependent helicase [Spirochaetes bacterium]|nr:ATP-dependent helicase [Spirochaetota bacterium]
MSELNKEQYRASRADTGVSLVIAGAGTGKTKTLVEKARSVIRDLPMDPAHLLLLTFSRKAAGELRERVGAGIASCGGITAATFHSFCLDLLRRNAGAFARHAGFAGFPSVIDDAERKKIVHDIIRSDLGRFLGLPAGVVYELMSSMDSLDPWKKAKLRDSGLMAELESLSARFCELKRERRLIDYDDMMDYAISLLAADREVRRQTLSRHRYIFVDEFQDVADDNIRLLKLLLPDGGGNLFAVGDDWQSIYGFRRARVDYIVRMRRHFPGAVVRRLTVNYRSRREIVSLAGRFIRKNRFRTSKRLTARRGKGGVVRLHRVSSFEEEIEVIDGILCELGREVRAAVLFRNNWQGRYLAQRLARDGRDVSFMTMHGSKGLEFDAVVVAGVCDSVVPDPDNDIEEERRLLYVACTRARDELHIIVHLDERGEPARFGRELGMGDHSMRR